MPDQFSLAICKPRGQLGVIAEVKQRRHEGVELLRGRPAAQIARTYQQAGADAISVVTSAWFGGSMQLLHEVVAADTGLPILRKDLIRSEADLHASRRAGASAVLLTIPLLGLPRTINLAQAAREIGLEPFVEASSRAEIASLRDGYGGILAINNSDIRTNETQGAGLERSLELLDTTDPRVWVSASRIQGGDDVRRLARAGFHAVLVGTHLLLAPDLRAATEQLVASARASEVAS